MDKQSVVLVLQWKYLAVKGHEVLLHGTTWMSLEKIILETCLCSLGMYIKIEKATCCVIPLI